MRDPGPAPLYEEFAPLRQVAVCRPIHFQLRAPINVIQSQHVAAGESISADRALAEHDELSAALRSAGSTIVEVAPDAAFPYQINTRDAGLGTPRGLILGRFRLPIRQGEEERVAEALRHGGGAHLGQVRRASFEGGDFIALDRRRAAVGLGPRTERAALAELQTMLGSDVELIGVPFADRFLHLDMIFNVVGERLALACPDALPPDFLVKLRGDGFRVLTISEAEVFTHGTNVLALGPRRILSHPANGRINSLLRAEGFELLVVGVAELAKSGGGPRCLTLPVARDG